MGPPVGAFYCPDFVRPSFNRLSPTSTVSLASIQSIIGDHTLNSCGWERESDD